MNANVWIKPAKLCCRCWIITLMVSLLCKNKTVLNNCQNGCEVGDEFQREHFAYCSRLWWILRHSFQLIWISTKRTVLFIGWKQRSGSVSPLSPQTETETNRKYYHLKRLLNWEPVRGHKRDCPCEMSFSWSRGCAGEWANTLCHPGRCMKGSG